MLYQEIIVEKKEIATITLNRPHRRNALTANLMQEILIAFEELDQDDTVKVIIKGAGTSFCTGAELEELISGETILEKRTQKTAVVKMLETISRIGKIVIAQVEGYALAGGCGLAVACDMVVASETAFFGLPEIHRSLFPMIVMAPISRAMGWKKGMEFYFTGDFLTGKQATELGLANYVVPPEELEIKTRELAAKIASKSSITLRLGKEAFYTMRDMEYFKSLKYLSDMLLITTMTEDAQEGINAFLEKREPQWKGK